jgi:two-component system sensor histidine kinase VanS
VSARLQLTLSYVALVVIAGALLLAVVWVFLLRYVPPEAVTIPANAPGGDRAALPELFIPGRGDLWQAFWPKAALALAALVAFGLVGGWVLAGRMLAPLKRITDATRLASTGSLSHRINLAGRGDEFRELADAFDTMLERIETQVGAHRRFAANASHELRTPLAITQSMLDAARNDPDRDTDQLLARLHAVNARAIALTEALLTLARADQRSFTNQPVDLSLLAEEAVELLLPLATKNGVAIETSGCVGIVHGSPTLLCQVVVNLAHNGIVHNLPAGGTVEIHTACADGTATLTVKNTGSVLAPEVVATLTEPFQRGQRIRAQHAGTGLGLAIVKSIVQAHDGVVTLRPMPSGGLRAEVRLPATQ